MHLSPEEDSRQWKLYETHRYPKNERSIYTLSEGYNAMELKHVMLAFMDHPDGFQIIMGWKNLAVHKLREDQGFLEKYALKPQSLDSMIKLMKYVKHDHINFARLDLMELRPEQADKLRLEAYKAAVEFHLYEPLLWSSSINLAREKGLLPTRN